MSSDSSTQFLPNGAKLRGSENYAQWKAQIKVILESKELQDFIVPASKPNPESDKASTELDRIWRTNNAKAKLVIMVHVTSEPAELINDLETAAEMWETLRCQYEGQGHNLKHSYFNEINSLRYEQFNSITAFIVRFKTLVSCLAQVNAKLPDDIYVILFINALDDAFPTWTERQRSNARSDSSLNLTDLCVDITDEARRSGSNRDPTTVLYTGRPEKGRGRTKKYRKDNNQKENTRQSKQCTHCGRKGHTHEDCWTAHPEKRPERGNDNDGKGFSLYSANTHANYRNSWLVDTGASEHMCHNLDAFHTFTESTSLGLIETASGTIKPQGLGCVKLIVRKTTGEKTTLELKNVLYIPGLPVNLFSGSIITKYGAYYCGKTNTIRRSKDDFEIAAIHLSGTSPLLQSCEDNQRLALQASTKPTIEVWHRRLGHLGYENVLKTASNTTGIELDGMRTQRPDATCRSCILSKSQRTISRKKQTRRSHIFDMVHTDVIGPITPRGYNGDLWAVTFTDDFSRYRWIYSFKQKNEACAATVNFIKYVKTQYNRAVKIIRMDNGNEYGGGRLLEFFRENGIKQEPTAPYTPEQDGVSERGNRTLLERVRSICIDTEAPKHLWPELFKGMIHIMNRTATSSVSNLTPHEVLNQDLGVPGERNMPSVSHIRTLGCKAYVHIQKERRIQSDKLGPRAEEGILVGFEDTRIYRVWIPQRNGITRSSTVTLDEDTNTSIMDLPETATQPSAEAEQPTPETQTPSDPTQSRDSEEQDAAQPPQDVNTTKRGRGRPPGTKNKPKIDATNNDLENPVGGKTPRPTRSTRSTHNYSELNKHGFTCLNESTQTSQAFIAALNADTLEPTSYANALQSDHAEGWKEAMNEEVQSLKKNKTWTVVAHPRNTAILKGRWTYKIKRDEKGNVSRYKARWVVKGYEQRFGIDYDQTFAGVAKNSAWKVVLSLAAQLDLEIEQMDVITAFLQGDIDEVIHVEFPHGYEVEGQVCRLNRALYGLKQSPRLWQQKLRATLSKLGYYPLSNDNCIYTSNERLHGITIITYVDDFLLLGRNIVKIQELKEILSKEFDMKNLGTCSQFLGVRITRDRQKRSIHLTQELFAEKVANSFRQQDAKPAYTPIDTSDPNLTSPHTGEATTTETKQYQSGIGSLTYAMCQTRPDLAFTVSVLSRHSHNPGPNHRNALMRAVRYLHTTKGYGITYKASPSSKKLGIHGYCDSDYAGDRETRRSTTGYVFFMANGPVSWKSTRQAAVTLSTTEAEYYALTGAAREAAWLRGLLDDLGYQEDDLLPTLIHGDNQGSLALAENPIHHQRSKHIDVQYHFIRQEVEDGKVTLNYVPTDKMTADGLTKGLPAKQHSKFIKQLGMEDQGT